MSTIRKLLAVAGVLVFFVATQAPASAHTDAVYHGADYAKVSADHRRGAVCDNEQDGLWVNAQFYLADGSVWGEYGQGADGPCTYLEFNQPAVEFEIWEEDQPRSFREWT